MFSVQSLLLRLQLYMVVRNFFTRCKFIAAMMYTSLCVANLYKVNYHSLGNVKCCMFEVKNPYLEVLYIVKTTLYTMTNYS